MVSSPRLKGPYRSDNIQENDDLPAGLQWGLAHEYYSADENYITRYEVSRPALRDPGLKKAN